MPNFWRARLAHISALVVTLWLVPGAMGRQRLMEAISPTDLAFYHQATYNAAHGNGFFQTVLEFDGSTLLGSLHLDLLRALFVPFYWLWPSVYCLVGLQALGMALGVMLVGALVRACLDSPYPGSLARETSDGGLPHDLTGLWVVLLAWLGAAATHPLTLELAAADVRPIVWMAPGVLLTVWALTRGSLLALLVGALVTLLAREEGIWLLLALVPYALVLDRGLVHRLKAESVTPPRQFSGEALEVQLLLEVPYLRVTLLLFCASLWAMGLMLVWGKLAQLSAVSDASTVIHGISSGTRGLFRSEAEVTFARRCLLPLLPGLLAPELLLPALLGWSVLTIFSGFEGVGPGGRGIHYLAVVYPLIFAAAAVGFGRMFRSWRRASGQAQRPRAKQTLGLLGVGMSTLVLLSCVWEGRPQWERYAAWWLGMFEPSGRVLQLEAHLQPVLDDPGPVLTVPRYAAMLAGRERLYVVGESRLTSELVTSRLSRVRYAVLTPPGEDEELQTWHRALEQGSWTAVGGDDGSGCNVFRSPTR